MMNRIYMLSFYLILSSTLLGQKEGNVWNLGEGLGINFNPNVPFIDHNNSMSTIQGCASYSDASGNLLFYTNGGDRFYNGSGSLDPGIIWDKNHNVMYDMGLLEGGGQSGRQTSIFFPKPGVPNHYFLFTLDDREAAFEGVSKGLSYFEIDMTGNGGLGEVVDHEPSIGPIAQEAMSACLHANGIDYWVGVINNTTELFDVFSVTSSGVNYATSSDIPIGFNSDYEIKFSPDGSKVVVGEVLMDFDNLTGQASNPIPVPTVYGFSFSANSRYLYFVDSADYDTNLKRYDVWANDILASLEIIYTFQDSGKRMQLGPDGNIYFFAGWPVEELSIIKCVNSTTPCVRRNISSPFPGPIKSFPNFTDHIFANQAIGDTRPLEIQSTNTSICEGETVDLSIYVRPDYDILWSNGSTSSTIKVTTEGLYTVTIDDNCCNIKSATIDLKCETTSITSILDKPMIKLFPNPAREIIYIDANEEIGSIQQVELFNMDAKLIQKTVKHGIQEIDVTLLDNGLYLARLLTDEGIVLNKRVMISN